MKALVCGVCADIRALDPDGWVTCRCGNASGRWDNPTAGTAIFQARRKDRCYVLGVNNQMLMPYLRGELKMFEDMREQHDVATNAPGYVFDKTRAACWAVIFTIGATSDCRWVTADEARLAPGAP